MLPKAGGWMDNVKALFGVLLLAVALWLIKHLLPESLLAIGWGLLAILAGLYLGALDVVSSPKAKLFKGIGLLALVAGAAMIFNALAPRTAAVASGPVAAEAASPFVTLRSQSQLDAALADAAANGQPVLLDFYADWCTACIEMEHENFRAPTCKPARRAIAGCRLI
ncbi:MAG: thioredoxin family protein [Gammaproteobacteria bacterium]